MIGRFRFTVRGMMVAVAIAGILIGGWVLRGRSGRYSRLAESNATDENFYRYAVSGKVKLGHPSHLPIFRDRLSYHELMRKKYERAARYPWLPVAPDPPEPE